jgi:hypothetical protein
VSPFPVVKHVLRRNRRNSTAGDERRERDGRRQDGAEEDCRNEPDEQLVMTIVATVGLLINTSLAVTAASRLIFAIARDGIGR